MTLYSADLTQLAKPVKKLILTHKKQREPEPETLQTEAPLKKKYQRKKKVDVEPTPEPTPEPEVKQTRKRKTKALEAPKVDVEAPTEVPAKKQKLEKVAPKEAPKTEKKLKVKPLPTPEISEEEIEMPKKKRIRAAQKESTEPPKWFQKYVEGVKKEEAIQKDEKVPAKQIKLEAQEAAQKSWDNGLTRDRVTNEIDSHMNRMYGMIFSKR